MKLFADPSSLGLLTCTILSLPPYGEFIKTSTKCQHTKKLPSNFFGTIS